MSTITRTLLHARLCEIFADEPLCRHLSPEAMELLSQAVELGLPWMIRRTSPERCSVIVPLPQSPS